MKPYFVSIENGSRVIHWTRLTAFAAVVFGVTVGVVEGLWYLVAHTLSTGALVVAVVIAALIVIRAVVRAVTYQEEELEMTAGSS
jgi:uncharacterized membrane protein HdeD (DUF308 family)